MMLRLLAHNAEHWLSRHLNAYLCDDDEYRAITRDTCSAAWPVITYTPDAITVTLDTPRHTHVTRALRLLLDELNTPHPPPRRPPTHHLPARRPHLSIQQLTHRNCRRSEPSPM